uniref:Uncharacterized protein n=1 Tax=Pyricularia oryzae (strain P131) TaxID=1143193 RepID=L7J030_PYRO1
MSRPESDPISLSSYLSKGLTGHQVECGRGVWGAQRLSRGAPLHRTSCYVRGSRGDSETAQCPTCAELDSEGGRSSMHTRQKSTEHVASDVVNEHEPRALGSIANPAHGGFNNPDGAHVFGERKPVPTFEEIMATKSIQTHVQKSLLDYGNMRKPVLYIDGVLSKQQPLVVK